MARDRSQVTVTYDEDEAEALARALLEKMRTWWPTREQEGERSGGTPPTPVHATPLAPSKPLAPPRPAEKAGREAWFEYKRSMGRAGIRCTLRQLAADMNLAYGYVRQLSADWQEAERDSEPEP